MYNKTVKLCRKDITSIPQAVRPSWLENAYSHPHLSASNFDP